MYGKFPEYIQTKKPERQYPVVCFAGYALGEKHGFLKRMWVNLAEQCEIYQHQDNYQKTLRPYLDFLKLCEKKKDIPEKIRVTRFISDLYIKLEDYQQAIIYANMQRNSDQRSLNPILENHGACLTSIPLAWLIST